MSNFPRFWNEQISTAGSSQAIIAIPAGAANVRHVLTSVHAKSWCTGGGAGLFNPQIQAFDGATLRDLGMWLVYDLAVSNQDTDSWAGSYVGSPGQVMTVQFSIVSPASAVEMLQIEGYDL